MRFASLPTFVGALKPPSPKPLFYEEAPIHRKDAKRAKKITSHDIFFAGTMMPHHELFFATFASLRLKDFC
jgi:uncharacterized protein (DUF305 family)